MDAVKLQNYRSFLDRLGEAMRQHQKNLEAARAEYETASRVWSEKRIEAESLGRSSIASARKSSTPPSGASSARATMRPCAWRLRRAASPGALEERSKNKVPGLANQVLAEGMVGFFPCQFESGGLVDAPRRHQAVVGP